MMHTLRDEMDCLEEFKALTEAMTDSEEKATSEESQREEIRESVRQKNKGGRPRKYPIPNADASEAEVRKALADA